MENEIIPSDDNKEVDVKPDMALWPEFPNSPLHETHSREKSPADGFIASSETPVSVHNSSPHYVGTGDWVEQRVSQPSLDEIFRFISHRPSPTEIGDKVMEFTTPVMESTHSEVPVQHEASNSDDTLPSPHGAHSVDDIDSMPALGDSPEPIVVSSSMEAGSSSGCKRRSDSEIMEFFPQPIDYSLRRRKVTAKLEPPVHPPCVVDLTEEDDDSDEISIVATEKPVEFLYSEKRLRKYKKRSADSSEAGPSRNLSHKVRPESQRDSRTPEFFSDLLGSNIVSIEEVETTELPPLPIQPVSDVREEPTTSREVPFDGFAQPSGNRPDGESIGLPPPYCVPPLRAPYMSYSYGNQDLLSLSERSSNLDFPFMGSYDYYQGPHQPHIPPVTLCKPEAPVPSTSSSARSELACPICFEPFHELKKINMSTSSTICGHMFCTKCLEESLRQSKTCPTCRKKLTKKQYHTVYLNFLD